jgi:hypothetical protein
MKIPTHLYTRLKTHHVFYITNKPHALIVLPNVFKNPNAGAQKISKTCCGHTHKRGHSHPEGPVI